ncbi:hypothetical protein GCM10027440_05090 [Nocardiopsis coralliicola]
MVRRLLGLSPGAAALVHRACWADGDGRTVMHTAYWRRREESWPWARWGHVPGSPEMGDSSALRPFTERICQRRPDYFDTLRLYDSCGPVLEETRTHRADGRNLQVDVVVRSCCGASPEGEAGR